MNRYYITMDSGCDVSMSVCKNKNIVPIPLEYTIDEEVFNDTMDPKQYHEFYEGMRNGKISRTSQINSETFLKIWNELLDKENLPIICFTMSSGISGTNSNAVKAAQNIMEERPEAKVHVVDTKTASVGEAMLAFKACEMREQGKTFDECVDWLEKNKNNVNTFFTTDTMKYLYRSGRVSKTKMVIGKALNINPILRVSLDGKLVVDGKVRGKKQTIDKIIEKIKSVVVNPQEQTLFVSHADVLDEAKEFAEAIMHEIPFKDVMYTLIGPSIGSHCGPGIKTAFFFGREKTL